ncbi:hypothetical protein HMPREF0541_00954 [Lacticaseibacillus rhamnosus ATCC 21052]|nr:hypothetical protein HMPREF0541_00954 [Lacticaseibacillus rhamnosus ATCC 21052]
MTCFKLGQSFPACFQGRKNTCRFINATGGFVAAGDKDHQFCLQML